MQGFAFNTPPGWPPPPPGWVPPDGWMPQSDWPPAPSGWAFWVPDTAPATATTEPTTTAGASSTDDAAAISAPSDQRSEPESPSDVEPVSPPPSREAGLAPSGTPLAQDPTQALQAEIADLRRQLAQASRTADQAAAHEAAAGAGGTTATADDDVVELDDARLLQQVGIYHYRHPLDNAEAYRERLAHVREAIKAMVKENTAIEASDRFSYNNSLAAGRKMTSDLGKLMLRAFNAEADNCIRALRAGALAAATKRLSTAADAIARLGKMMEMRVSPGYHALRITELELVADYMFQQQEERQAAREERERLREERRVEAELTAQREKLDKERAHYANTLAALRARGEDAEAADLQARLVEIDEAIAQNDFRAANIRAGYVYVISNIGAFGKSVVKIGMTRRLEPMDRVRELGDASVPFPFDVHALYFSDDAVTLETDLHNAFADRRVNHANPRREFFFATPEEVRAVLVDKVGNLLEYTAQPEAEQYWQSRGSWPTDLVSSPGR